MEVLLQLHIKTVTHLGQMEPTSAEQGRFDTSMYQCKAPHGHEGENPHDRLRKNPKLKHAVSVFCCCFFLLCYTACGILVPGPGIEPVPLHWKGSLNH